MTNSDITTNAMTIAFIEEYEKRFNIKIKKSNDIKNAKNIYKIDTNEGKAKCYLYINKSKNIDFWGFSNNMIEQLRKTDLPYFLILLSNHGNSYCFPHNIIQILCTKLKSDEKDNFKVNLDDLTDYDKYKIDWNNLNLSESISTMEERIETVECFKEFIEDTIFEGEYQNNKENKSKEESIKDKCKVIADIVNSLRDNYKTKYLGTKQADFLETVVGAAIFYIKPKDTWWNGKVIVSEKARKQREFCADHIIPRKKAAGILLKKGKLTGDDVHNIINNQFGKVVYLTKSENASFRDKDIKDIDKLFDFDVLKKMYATKDITLKEITKKEFNELKK